MTTVHDGITILPAGAPLTDPIDDDILDNDRDHLTCCIDEDRALCGRHIGDLDYTDTLGDVCSACWKLFEDGDGRYCPRGWICPDLC